MTTPDTAWMQHWFPVPHALFRPDLPLDPTARLVYIYLLHWGGDAGQAFPGYTRMAADLGCSRSSAIRACRALVAAGLLHKVARPGTTNRYQLQHPGVDPCTTADDAGWGEPAQPSAKPAPVVETVDPVPEVNGYPDPGGPGDPVPAPLRLVTQTRGGGPVDLGAGLCDQGAGQIATRLRLTDPDLLINKHRSRSARARSLASVLPDVLGHPLERGRPPAGWRPASPRTWHHLRCPTGHEWASWSAGPPTCPTCGQALREVR